jgi:hypothetical protein
MESEMGTRSDLASLESSSPWDSRTIFNESEEKAITDHICDDWRPGRLFTDAIFLEIAAAAFLENYRDQETPAEFQCSPGFISGFKERNHFSFRRARLKCHATVTEDDEITRVMVVIVLGRRQEHCGAHETSPDLSVFVMIDGSSHYHQREDYGSEDDCYRSF